MAEAELLRKLNVGPDSRAVGLACPGRHRLGQEPAGLSVEYLPPGGGWR